MTLGRFTWLLALCLALASGCRARPATHRWNAYDGILVLTAGSGNRWDNRSVGTVQVVRDGESYRMYYAGATSGDSVPTIQIGLATSEDGVEWTKHEEGPVLPVGRAGEWDAGQVGAPAVIHTEDGWQMWYAGNDGHGNGGIGHATSQDGFHWNKSDANPVLRPGPGEGWDSEGVFSPSLVVMDGTYQLWYGGSTAGSLAIGFASSSDGIRWEKLGDNPVFEPGPEGSWDADVVTAPDVLILNGEYHLWYQGGANEGPLAIGQATSRDGIAWIRDSSNPGLKAASLLLAPNDDVYYPSVILDDGSLRMWYHTQEGVGYAVKRLDP